MNFSFMKNNNEVFDSQSKNNKLNVFFTNKKVKKRRKVYKRYPHINQISSPSFGTSSNFSKSNTFLLILIGYVILGYIVYQLLK